MTRITQPTLSFDSSNSWEAWLAEQHAISNGIWLRIYKKASNHPTVTYAEALDVALCYGWIDGQKNRYDDVSWVQKFTPRRPRSNWSKVNTEHVVRLVQSGKMKPAGLKEVEAAKLDGRWKQAYDPQRTATFPEEFLKRLHEVPEAEAFFQTINKSNKYAIAYRLNTAKRLETKEKRIKEIIEMLAKSETFH